MRFALIQYSISSDFFANKKKVSHLLYRALKSRSRYLILPEMWLGAPQKRGERGRWAARYRVHLREIRAWAGRNRTGFFFSQLEKSGTRFFNTAYFIGSDGKIRGRYRKIHLFSLGGESRLYSPGSRPEIFSSPLGKIGMAICYDIRFPELIRSLAVKGAKLLIVPAQWPAARREHWAALLKARAIENQIFVIGVNRTGRKGKMSYGGGSLVFDPWGRRLMHLPASRRLGICDLDLKEAGRIRKKYPFFAERKLV